jgi:hypothetical protein
MPVGVIVSRTSMMLVVFVSAVTSYSSESKEFMVADNISIRL